MTDPIAAARALIEPLTGYTPGPWSSFIDDSGDEWTGWPLSISPASDEDKTVVRPGGQWPYKWDTKISQHEACQNAHLIAAAPDLRDMVATLADALEAERAENQRLRGALRIIAGYVQGLDNLMSNSDIARAALSGEDET